MAVLFRTGKMLPTVMILILHNVNYVLLRNATNETIEWCRYQIYTHPRTWLEARAVCEQNNKILAHITNQPQLGFLRSFLYTDLSMMYSAPPDPTLWIGLYKKSAGFPTWQDDCSAFNTGTYSESLGGFDSQLCYRFDGPSMNYEFVNCEVSNPFLCQAETLDTNSCYAKAATVSNANTLTVMPSSVAHRTECHDLCTGCCCVGFYYRHDKSDCVIMTSKAIHHMSNYNELYTKDILQTSIVNIVSMVHNIEEVCYTSSPVIESTLAPDAVQTSTSTQVLKVMPSTEAYWSSTATVMVPTDITAVPKSTEPISLELKLNGLLNNVILTKTNNMAELAGFSEILRQLVDDNQNDICSFLDTVLQIEQNITEKMAPHPRESGPTKTTLDSYLHVLTDVKSCQGNVANLLELEDALVGQAKLFLSFENTSYALTSNGISMALTVGDGDELQTENPTLYGSFVLQNLAVLRRRLSGQKVMTMAISYQTNPFYPWQQERVNIPVLTTSAFDKDGIPLSDFDFMTEFPIPSEHDVTNGMMAMIPNGTHNMAAFPGGFFNSSFVTVVIDVTMMESCRIFGKYGTTSPTNQDFDFYLYTDGLSSVRKYRPYEFIFSYRDGIVQTAIYKTPVVFDAQCQGRRMRRKRSVSNGGLNSTNDGYVPTIGVIQVSPKVIDRQTGEWISDNDLQLDARTPSKITLQSYFFGTFSASVELLAPDLIDFNSVFLNFSQKLNDTPYVLGTILAVVFMLLFATPFLRRRDTIDSALWSYEHLVDNKPGSPFHYYISVSTGVRSKRHMDSPVYINMIGTSAETGPRLLTKITRKNFTNGTSSHFCLTTDTYLGNIMMVQIWLGPNDKSQSWFLQKILIVDGQSRNAVLLKCNKWFSLEKDTGQTWRTLKLNRNNEQESSLLEVSTKNIFNDHLWFSLILRPAYSRFTRVQRVWCIVSLLFLSMVASAMFYDTPDTTTTPLINISGFEIGLKEIYTGFMSSAITVVPCMIMTYIFTHRKRRGEITMALYHDGKEVSSSGSIPWWSIFIAYLILLICICSGSFFTFLYSLEWGPTLTLKWMSSFFLGTSESVIFIDPTKAFIISVVTVVIFSSNHNDFNIPSTSLQMKPPEDFNPDHALLDSIDCPCDKEETLDQRKRRQKLKMDRELNSFFRKLLLGLMYVVMLLVICTQQKVSDVFGQNMFLKHSLKSSQMISTKDDVWHYINSVVVPSLSPTEFYNGEVKPFNELRYIGSNYRMGPIRIRQTRVSASHQCVRSTPCTPKCYNIKFKGRETKGQVLGDRDMLHIYNLRLTAESICNAPLVMKTHGITCIPDFDEYSEDTRDYTEGWITSNNSESLPDHMSPYRYHNENSQETPSYSGHFGTYGGGGYLVDLDFEPSKATDVLNRLQSNAWLDYRTRAVFIEACIVNRNNMLFSQIEIVFEFPSIGGVFPEYRVSSSNLYPYREPSDFIILAVQIVFVVVILVRIVMFVVTVIRTRGHSLFSFRQIVDLVDLVVSVAAIVFLINRFTSTIAILNTLRHEIGFYSSFGYIFQWDYYFSACLGTATCIAILDLLQHLSFNYHFYLMYNTITKFRKEIFQFTALLTTLMVGFAGFIFLLYGHVEGSFRNVTSGLLTLFRMTIGMIKFRHDLELDVFGITVIISLYALAITMVYINMFSSALNFGITHIKDMIAKGQTSFNWQLNQHFWNRVSSLLLPCRASRKVESQKNVKDGIKTELRKKIDFQRKVETSVGHFISKLIERSVQDSKLEKDFFRQTLLPSQHFKGSNFIWSIRRETTLGVQYRFSTKCTDRDNAFILEFLHEKVDCGIDMECLQITEAINRGLIPYGHGTQPVSSLYIVHITNYRTDSCKVFVKVATSQLSSQTAFLITGSHEPTRWEQHTAQHVGDDANHVYLSAILPMCPQYVLAVTSDLWCGVQSVIHQEHVKKFNLTTKKMTVTPGSKQQMFLSFPPNSVQKDTIVKTVMEQGVRFPTLHVLASRDVKGPIIVEYVGKERTDELSSEHFMEIQLLTKTGDLEWRQESTWAPNNDRDNTVELDSLKAGVKMAVTIRLSDYIVSSAKITNRYLERERGTLLGIYKKNIPTKHWKQVGRSLGVPQHKLAKIENTKPRSLEEKACLVLRYWLRENHGRGLQDIQNIWKQRVV